MNHNEYRLDSSFRHLSLVSFDQHNWFIILLFTMAVLFLPCCRQQPSLKSQSEQDIEKFAPDAETTIAEVEAKRIKELIPPGYQGPLIELNFRDDKGNRVSARKVLILPVSDQSAGGSGWSLESSTNDIIGANCLRTALIDGPISGRGFRANTEYYAQSEEHSIMLYTPQEAAEFSFRTPKYDASTRLHEMDVTLHEPN
jgi:hypothetical protein